MTPPTTLLAAPEGKLRLRLIDLCKRVGCHAGEPARRQLCLFYAAQMLRCLLTAAERRCAPRSIRSVWLGAHGDTGWRPADNNTFMPKDLWPWLRLDAGLDESLVQALDGTEDPRV